MCVVYLMLESRRTIVQSCNIRIMFDAGATLWWFGEGFPTYKWTGASSIMEADGTSIQVHGALTI